MEEISFFNSLAGRKGKRRERREIEKGKEKREKRSEKKGNCISNAFVL